MTTTPITVIEARPVASLRTRRTVATFAVVVSLAVGMLVVPATPAEASYRATTPSVACNSTLDRISVHTGLKGSYRTVTETAVQRYMIQYWDVSTRRWRNLWSSPFASHVSLRADSVVLPTSHRVVPGRWYRVSSLTLWYPVSGRLVSWGPYRLTDYVTNYGARTYGSCRVY